MNHALQRIDEIIEERSLLKHPFYRMLMHPLVSECGLTAS